jgi:hypothetical protein
MKAGRIKIHRKKVRTSTFVFVTLLSLFSFISCEGDLFNDCLSGRGNPASERRTLYPFNNIEVHDNINLTIEQSNEHSITINTGHKLIPMITNFIRNNTLIIRNESPCRLLKDPWKKVDVHVKIPTLDSLFMMSQGSVNTKGTVSGKQCYVSVLDSPGNIQFGFDMEIFILHFLKGTADVVLNGYSDKIYIYHIAAGKIDALNCKSEHSHINTHAYNDISINAGKKSLNVQIQHIGNVFYRNDPEQIRASISGEGRLIRLDQ